MNETQQTLQQQVNAPANGSILEGFSIEATAQQIEKVENLSEVVPQGTSVYIPYLPGANYSESFAAVDRLARAGLKPVPHIAARSTKSISELDETLAQFVEYGVDSVFLIAGDTEKPAGPFTSTLEVLASGQLEKHRIRKIGFAAHPEGHPVVDISALDNALRLKASYAQSSGADIWLASQFTFDAAPIAAWLDRLSLMDILIPVRVGIPGPAKMRSLLSFAMKCGIANSARALSRRPETARMLLGTWSPASLVEDLAAYKVQSSNAQLAGVHVFSFGGFAHSAKWMQDYRAGN
ncbi:MAG: methylenetetrahydrofolate reductase [Pseudomonadota bacterium]